MAQLNLITRVPTIGELLAINGGLVGFWPFQGDATDEDPTGSDLSVTAGESFAHALLSEGLEGAWIGGNAERRAYDRTTVDASLRLDGDLSISCLFTLGRAQNPAAGDGIVLCECAGASEASTAAFSGTGIGAGLRYLLSVEDEGYVVASFSNGAGDGALFRFGHEARVAVGVPNHLTLRKSGTTAEIFINGVSIGTETVAATGNGTGTTFVVGRSHGSSRNFNGAIAGLAVWNAALAALDVADLYALHTVTVGDTPVASRASLVGTAIDFSGPEYLTQAISSNTTYTLTNPVIGKVINLDIDVTGTPSIDVTGAVFIRKDAVTAGRMILKLECIDEDTPTFLATLSDTV